MIPHGIVILSIQEFFESILSFTIPILFFQEFPFSVGADRSRQTSSVADDGFGRFLGILLSNHFFHSDFTTCMLGPVHLVSSTILWALATKRTFETRRFF